METLPIVHDSLTDAINAAHDAFGVDATFAYLREDSKVAMEAVTSFPARIEAFTRDPDLTSDAKLRRAKEQQAEVISTVETALQRSAEKFSAWKGQQAPKVQPAPPVDDPAVLEAKLGNARADARMLFDPVPADQLSLAFHKVLPDLAPDVAFLLLGTPWMATYLQARNASDATLRAWKELHRQALPTILTEQQTAQRAALESLAYTLQMFSNHAAHAAKNLSLL